MSTEAEIVTFEGRRYRVAGKSGPGVEPKGEMIIQWQEGKPYRLAQWLPVEGVARDAWNQGLHKILLPLDASPPAETPRCEAPGLKAGDPIEVLINGAWRPATFVRWVEEGTGCEYTRSNGLETGAVVLRCVRAAAPACADRARAAAGGEPRPGGGSRKTVPDAPASPIPSGYRLAKGWEVLKMPGWFNGDAWFCFAADADDCPGGHREPALLANRRDRIRGACLNCAERRGAIERVEDRQGLEALAGEVREKLREIGASPAAPCLSHHPELGSRCEAPPGPHDMHIGRRPGTAERCEWWDALAPAESREERWRRTHPGYQRLPDKEAASAMTVIDDYGRTDGADMIEERRPATKPAPWSPGDPDGDIPNAWEVGRKAMRPWR